MNHRTAILFAVALSIPASLTAQAFSSSQNPPEIPVSGGSRTHARVQQAAVEGSFSHLAFSAGISPLGISLSTATNLTRSMNLRFNGNIFKTTISDLSKNGFTFSPQLNLASAGMAVDFFPWPNHGFRLSPGVLFYNENGASADFLVAGGTTFTLNDHDFYSSTTNPVKGHGSLGLHSDTPAFTATAGWGNVIPRNGGHWSFPVEVGVALIGSPDVNIALNQGQVCVVGTNVCDDVATDPIVQSNLRDQVAQYKKDLDPLKTYPIVSFGVAYSFRIR